MKADNYTDIPSTGSWGNRSGFISNTTFAAVAIATEVDLMKLPPGTELTDLHAVFDALDGGAASTVSFGWKYEDGSTGGGATALAPAQATGVAGDYRGAFKPIFFSKEVILTATVGGAAVTGALDVDIDYTFRGTL